MNVVLWVKPKPYVGDVQPDGPDPQKAGLREGVRYRVLDIHDNGDMAAEAYFSVVNEKDEVWFVSNRHFLVSSVEDNLGLQLKIHRFLSEYEEDYN